MTPRVDRCPICGREKWAYLGSEPGPHLCMACEQEPSNRLFIIQGFCEACATRYPLLREPWLHLEDNGKRLWLSEGEHGPIIAQRSLLAVVRRGACRPWPSWPAC